MLKKLLSLVLCITLLSGTLNVYAADEAVQYSGKCGENAYWKLENGVLTISGTGEVTERPQTTVGLWKEVPKKLIVEEGITALKTGDLVRNTERTTQNELDYLKDGVSLPSTLTCIGEDTFMGANFSDVTIPQSVTSIEERAFGGCKNLKEVLVPEKVTRLEKDCFCACVRLEKVTLPKALQYIGESAFDFCYNLKEIMIPSTVTEIGASAFVGCWNLEKVTLPEGIKEVKDKTFYECMSLKSIQLPEGVERIGKNAFAFCRDMETCNCPSTVTQIAEKAFHHCVSLKTMQLSETALQLGKYAFKDCTRMESITLPSQLQSISEGLLSGCAALKKITFPETIQSIGYKALEGCYSIKQVTIPAGVKSMKSFEQDCPDLKKIVNLSSISYSLKGSKEVKDWYQKKKKVKSAGAGKTVTAKNKTFRITYSKKVKGCEDTVMLNGKVKTSYTYGEHVKLPVKATVVQKKKKKNASIDFVGWEYEANNKKYQTGRMMTWRDTYVYKLDKGTKGDIQCKPLLQCLKTGKYKNKTLKVTLLDHGNPYKPVHAMQLEEDLEKSGISNNLFVEARYADNKNMKHATYLETQNWFGKDTFTIPNVKKGKTYYIQLRRIMALYCGVPYEQSWGPVVKITAK